MKVSRKSREYRQLLTTLKEFGVPVKAFGGESAREVLCARPVDDPCAFNWKFKLPNIRFW